MEETIAKTLKIEKSQINIKATTEEGLGFTGKEEGISAQAIAALETVENYRYYEIDESKPKCTQCNGCPKSKPQTL